ncbi:hypothetical protein Tco_1563176 [Tanacetum coccineum]
MRTRSQSRNSNRQQQQVNPTFVEPFNLVEPIENQAPPVVTMDDTRTMTQLLEAPTVGYEDAIVVPDASIGSITSILRSMNATSSKTDERIDKLAYQLSTLVEIVSKKVVTPGPVKAVEENLCIGVVPFFAVEGALGWGYISLGAFRIWCLQAIRLTTTRVFVSLSTTIRVRFGTAAFRGCLVLLFHGTERLVAGLQPKRAVWFIGVKGVFGLGINTQHRGV